jgi:uncharacterized protein YukE
MDRLDAAQLELEEAMERLANALNAWAYEIERAAEKVREANDRALLLTN